MLCTYSFVSPFCIKRTVTQVFGFGFCSYKLELYYECSLSSSKSEDKTKIKTFYHKL